MGVGHPALLPAQRPALAEGYLAADRPRPWLWSMGLGQWLSRGPMVQARECRTACDPHCLPLLRGQVWPLRQGQRWGEELGN